MRIGVAIPCYKYHIPLLKRCLDSIEAQTLKVDQVVVSCSSTEEADLPQFNYSFPLTIITTPKRQNAAQNRNQAATLLNTEIVSFFDADDVMHPQRLEFVKFAFYWKPEAKIILHSYIDAIKFSENFVHYDAPKLIPQACERAPSGCVIIKSDWQKPIHHSQASIHHSVFQTHKFLEGVEYERREDALFCGRIVAAYPTENIYIENSLSKYYMEGSTHV